MPSTSGSSFPSALPVSNADARAALITMSAYSDRTEGVTKEQARLARATVDRFIRECRLKAGVP